MNKEIYVLRNERDLLAFTVCTHKRGGSVKIGPTGTPARYRRQGYASQLRDVVEEHLFHHAGARKLTGLNGWKQHLTGRTAGG